MPENQEKMDFLTQLIEKLKKIEHDQQITVEHLAKVQMEVEEADKETLAAKINEVFANASKNTQLLHESIEQLTMKFNRLKSGG